MKNIIKNIQARLILFALFLIQPGASIFGAVATGTVEMRQYNGVGWIPLQLAPISSNGVLQMSSAGTPSFSATPNTTSLNITGTAGSGFVDLAAQASEPSAGAATNTRLFFTLANGLGFFTAGTAFSANLQANITADRVYSLQNVSSTLAMYSNDLSVFASTTSAQMRTLLSDETGTGVAVFGTNPTLTGATMGTTSTLQFGATAAVTLGVSADTTSGDFNITPTAIGTATTGRVRVMFNSNGDRLFNIDNATNGAGATSNIRVSNGGSASTTGGMAYTAPAYTPSGVIVGNQFYIYGGSGATGGIILNTESAAPVVIAYNNTEVARAFSATVFRVSGLLRLKGYTVATLPGSPAQGDTAFVTDALTPTWGAVAVGGGAVVTKVFYNGTAWITD